MSSTPSRIGRYEIKARLGSGGMGEVFRGRDDKLGRDVAIKVILEEVSEDPDRLKRFEREAKTLAQLSHPNVAQIYGFEADGDRHFLVLELVEGESLRDRIQRGAIEIPEAVDIARQIAEGLEAIHDAGLIHRDLKPANVRITPAGVVKILDFGLAKVLAEASPLQDGGTFAISLGTGVGESAPSPVGSSDSFGVTADGAVLGTPVYMSPEQVRGKPIDRRADIWAFGCVLFECLTGRRAFSGDTPVEVFAAIVGKELDFDSLPGATPARVRDLLGRCLEKDARVRLRDAGEARIALARALTRDEPPSSRGMVGSGWRWAALAGFAVALATGAALIMKRQETEPASGTLREARKPRVAVFSGAGSRTYLRFAMSPDGTRLVHGPDDAMGPGGSGSGHDQRLIMRSTNSFESAPVDGTEAAVDPFFSPDGTNLAFTDLRALSLVVMPVSGGAARSVARVDQASGASWAADGSILAGHVVIEGTVRLGISRVFVDDRPPVPITTLAGGEHDHLDPVLLPGGRWVLFSLLDARGFSIAVVDASGGKHRIVMAGASPTFVPPGSIIAFDHQRNRLMAARFDPVKASISGSPRAVVEDVASTIKYGGGSYEISGDGTLLYTPFQKSDATGIALQWAEAGKAAETVLAEDTWHEPSLSPDGRRIVVRKRGLTDCSLWLYELERAALTRLTSEGDAHGPIWHPDGKRVICSLERRPEPARTVILPIDGSSPPETIHVHRARREGVTSISPDGKVIAFSRFDEKTGLDVWVASVPDGQDATAFVASPCNEGAGSFSPDGKWLAYVSDETGARQIYVRAFPGGGARYPVSTNGGRVPRWSRDGRRLFFAEGARLLCADVDASNGFVAGKPRVVIEDKRLELESGFDLSADGARALVLTATKDGPSSHDLCVVYSWTNELAKLP